MVNIQRLLLIGFLVTFARVGHAQLHFTLFHLNHGYDQVEFINDSTCVELGDTALYLTTDGAITWKQWPFNYNQISDGFSFDPTKSGYNSIYFHSADHGYSFGEVYVGSYHDYYYNAAQINETLDSGRTWQLIANDGGMYSSNIYAFICARDSNWYYGETHPLGNGPSSITNAVNGRTGKAVWPTDFNFHMESIDFRNDSIGMAADLGNVMKLSDSGKTVKEVLQCRNLYSNTKTEVYWMAGSRWLVCGDERLFESTNDGDTWDTVLNVSEGIYDFNCFHHKDCYILSSDYYLESQDSGRTWKAHGLPQPYDDWGSIFPTGSQSLWVSSPSDLLHITGTDSMTQPVMTAPRVINFGNVPISIRQTTSILIKNVGDTILHADSVVVPNSRVSVAPNSFFLKPNDTLRLTFTYTADATAPETLLIDLITNTKIGQEDFIVLGAGQQSSVGLSSGQRSPSLLIWPNPTIGIATLQANAVRRIEVIDVLGNCQYTREFSTPKDDPAIDISTLPDGMYYLLAKIGSNTLFSRFVKQ